MTDMIFKCLECGERELVYPNYWTGDMLKCKKCGETYEVIETIKAHPSHLVPILKSSSGKITTFGFIGFAVNLNRPEDVKRYFEILKGASQP